MSKRDPILTALGLNVRKRREARELSKKNSPRNPASIPPTSATSNPGNLFFTLADIIDYHRPEAFVLENVKNLRSQPDYFNHG